MRRCPVLGRGGRDDVDRPGQPAGVADGAGCGGKEGCRIVGVGPGDHLLGVAHPVVVAVRVVRVGAVDVYLVAVIESVIIRIRVERVGRVDVDLVGIVQTVVIAVGVRRVGTVGLLFEGGQPIAVAVSETVLEALYLGQGESDIVDLDVVQDTPEASVLALAGVRERQPGAGVVVQVRVVGDGSDQFPVDVEAERRPREGTDDVIPLAGDEEVVGRLDPADEARGGIGDLKDKGVEFGLIEGVAVTAPRVLLGQEQHRAVRDAAGDGIPVKGVEVDAERHGEFCGFVVRGVRDGHPVVRAVEPQGVAEDASDMGGPGDRPVVSARRGIGGDGAGFFVEEPQAYSVRRGHRQGIQPVLDLVAVAKPVTVTVGEKRVGAVRVQFVPIGKSIPVGVRVLGVRPVDEQLLVVEKAVAVAVRVGKRDVEIAGVGGDVDGVGRILAPGFPGIVRSVPVAVAPGEQPVVPVLASHDDLVGPGGGHVGRERRRELAGVRGSDHVDRSRLCAGVCDGARERPLRSAFRHGRIGAVPVFLQVGELVVVGIVARRLREIAEVVNLPGIGQVVLVAVHDHRVLAVGGRPVAQPAAAVVSPGVRGVVPSEGHDVIVAASDLCDVAEVTHVVRPVHLHRGLAIGR